MARVTRSDGGLVTALIYTRVSSEDQRREGMSLDAQLADCRRYAARQGWMIGGEFQDVMSGKRDDRPHYQALLDKVRRLRADGRRVVVVVLRLDRLGRRLLERVQRREEFTALGVAVHSVREGEVNDMVAGFLALMAEDEVRRLGERVTDSFGHIRSCGWKKPGRPPWGYRWRPANDEERGQGAPKVVLEIDPEAEPYVRELFTRAAAGEPIRRLRHWVAALPEDARHGMALGYRPVREILSNPVYVGRAEDDRDPDVRRRRRGRWPALVDDEAFRRVQQRIADHQRMPRQASGKHLLTGLLRCPRCGARMASAGPANGLKRYGCRAENAGRPACQFTVVMHKLDRLVLDEVESLVAAVATDSTVGASIAREYEALRRPDREAEKARRGDLARQEQAAAKARRRLTDAAVLLVDGMIDKAGYERLRDKAQADLEGADAELARLRGEDGAPTLPPLDRVLREVGGWAAALRSADTPSQREVLGAMIETLVPHRLDGGAYRLEIAWTSTGHLLRQLSAALGRAA